MASWAAADVAPQIDRLVLAVNDAVDSGRLAEAAGDQVVDWVTISQLGDFLAAGVLTEDIAVLRSRYRPPAVVLGRIAELEQQGMVERRGSNLAASPALRPLIEAVWAARADAAATMWRDHQDDVKQASRTAEQLAALASDDHVVAAAHRSLPRQEDPNLRLHTGLFTLRYVRQHDHAAAWLAHDLTAAGVVAMTGLWQDEPITSGAGLDELVARGLAMGEPPALTDEGRGMREEIETDTNERAQQIFTALGEDPTAEFLATLRRLPG